MKPIKIKDSKKGIVPVTGIELPEKDIPEDIAKQMISEDEQGQEEATSKNQITLSEWNEQGHKNFEALFRLGNDDKTIAERLNHIFTIKKIEKTEFAKKINVSRTTLHRYINGDSKPSKETLLRILNLLGIDVADFCYALSDFNEWKDALETESYHQGRDLLSYRQEVLHALERNNFIYKHNGKVKELPQEYFDLLKSVIESGFKILDLLPHDEGWKSWIF